MADHTEIEWTEATWNPITGCSVTSPGCTNCYAMKLAGTRLRHHPSRAGLTQDSKAGPVWTGEVRFNEQWLTQPLQWKTPRMIFVCAHGDLFHESVPDEWIDRVFAVMALCPQHTFQVLTKRSARMREYFGDDRTRWDRCESVWLALGEFASVNVRLKDKICNELTWGRWKQRWPLPNVWLGVSVEDQQRADERIPDLLATPAAIRWLSCEPLLGPVDLDTIVLRKFGQRPTALSNRLGDYIRPLVGNFVDSPKIHWIVAGGESGAKARPMHPDWARSLRDQCAAAGVPFFFKQWGNFVPREMEPEAPLSVVTTRGRHMAGAQVLECAEESRAAIIAKVGKKRAGRLLDGEMHDAFPQVARS